MLVHEVPLFSMEAVDRHDTEQTLVTGHSSPKEPTSLPSAGQLTPGFALLRFWHARIIIFIIFNHYYYVFLLSLYE